MAVVLLNQAPYRRTYASTDRLNDTPNDGSELWIFQTPDLARINSNHVLHRSVDRKNRQSPDFTEIPPCQFVGNKPHVCTLDKCERVTINVSGLYYETWASVLNKHPTTLLGNPQKRMKFYDRRRNEFFFDRHRPTFDSIFNYYQYGGKLRRPEPVPDDIFLSELDFFEVENDVIERYKKDEGYIAEKIVLPENRIQRLIWMVVEYPESSTTAYILACLSVLITLISIVLFCVETLPEYSKTHCKAGEAPNFLDAFFVIESICTAWFTIELLVRLVACPSKPQFFKDFKNLIDVMAIAPYYVTLINVLWSMSCEGAKSSASLAFLRVVRLIRVFKLTKHSSGLQVLILTFQASMQGLGLFFVAVVVCVLLFSSAIYYAEQHLSGSEIKSIPDGFWWAIITMATVGYGDCVPVGPWGKLIGSMCALAGVLTLAIPVPIITENFNKFYAHRTGRGKI
ncbi:potassium voltage-gated channel protein Shaker-like [Liolophura sinensis]|uniref:potassium voltage-gated channel protein Shaker-like n=1 Tax=Liolophura sinensis TaxID=3198878 RepID=UPI0031582ED8